MRWGMRWLCTLVVIVVGAARLSAEVGPPGGSPCASACDCPGAAVCHHRHCVKEAWANGGHPARTAFACCAWYRRTGACTAAVGCQEADGRVVNCAGAVCRNISCATVWDCAEVGCTTACDPTTNTCH